MFLRRLSLILGLLFIVNFALFWVHSFYLGGDAINGKVAEGHYFVGMHGHFIEVTPDQYSFSRMHALSLFLTVAANIAIQVVAYLVGGKSRIKPQKTRLSALWTTVALALFVGIFAGDIINLPWLRLAWYVIPLPFLAGYIEMMVQEWTPRPGGEDVPPSA